MARNTVAKNEDDMPDRDITVLGAQYNWDDNDAVTTYESRTTVIFENIGDQFTGIYEGAGEITDPNTGEVYKYFNFAIGEEKYQFSNSWTAERGLEKVPVGSLTRLTLKGFADMGPNKSPLKNIKVQYKG